MRFVADESTDFAVVRALRAAGHDVLATAETSPRSDDEDVIRLAAAQKRILLTEDKDFGHLVYSRGEASVGVLFLRFPAGTRSRLAETVCRLVESKGEHLIGRFVVVQPGRIRLGRTPV